MAKKDHIELSREQIYAEEDALIDFQFALIDAMKDSGMTKAELAKVLGVSRARISQMFSSNANPTLKLAARALFAVGMKNKYCKIKEDMNASCSDAMPNMVNYFKPDVAAWHPKPKFEPEAAATRTKSDFKWRAFQRVETSYEVWEAENHTAANRNFTRATEAA